MSYKILLLGSGQVSSELVTAVESLEQSQLLLASRHRPNFGTTHSWYAADLCNTSELMKLIAHTAPSVIINAAAYTAVDKAETERELAKLVNADSIAQLTKAASDCHAALIHFSTDYVFSGTGTTPFKESDSRSPVNYYGESKALGEIVLEDSICRWVNFRTQWVYAPHGHNFVKTMLRLGREKKELRIIDDQWGAPTSARAIAEGVRAFLDLELKSRKISSLFQNTKGHYHLVCSGETTWYQFAREIFSQARDLGFPLQIEKLIPIATEDYPTPAIRPKNSRLDTSKLRALGISLPNWQAELRLQLPKIIKEISN